jgi:hypothetical protein
LGIVNISKSPVDTLYRLRYSYIIKQRNAAERKGEVTMTTQARKYFNFNEYDNTALDVKNLEKASVRSEKKCKTAYIFSDESAIIDLGDNNYKVVSFYK